MPKPRTAVALATVTLAALAMPAIAAADPTFGTWLSTRRIDTLAGVPSGWGAGKGSGWTALPSNLVHVESGGTDYPLCLSNPLGSAHGAKGWAGLGFRRTVNGVNRLECSFHGASASESGGGVVFELPANRPAPSWTATNATTPEPWGAVLLATQETSNRRIYACSVVSGSTRSLGYIGDDGRCYHVHPSTGAAVDSSYEVMVKSQAPGDVAPHYGWVDAGPGYLPHGQLASASQADILSAGKVVKVVNPKQRRICRVRDANVWWPGYLDAQGTRCDYFTYFNNATQRKSSASFQVFRLGPGSMITNYRFGSHDGKSFHSCVAYKSGIADDTVWGFSSNTTACTDGNHTANANVRTLGLPNVDADRG